MPYVQNATSFLVQAIIGFALYIVLIRFWMQWVRADFRNELGQFIITVTNPLVIPLRKVIPSYKTLDTSTVLLAYAICILKIFALLALAGTGMSITNYLIMGVGLFIKASIYLFLAAIFIQIIASWISPQSYHPIVSVARSIGEPLLAPARRIIPAIGGLDLSPIVVILFLQFTLRLIVTPLLPLSV